MSITSQGVFMYVISLKFSDKWWELSKAQRGQFISTIGEVEKSHYNKLGSIKRYNSLRDNGDIIYWVADTDTSNLNEFRYSVLSSLSGLVSERLLFFSYFKPSPYTGKTSVEILKYIKQEPLRYFVAYPMKKTVDWYLLPFEERKEVMDEHINVARSHPDNKGIRSYTTYSFGIGDYEFVVIYEIPELDKWINVVERLREVKARKWVAFEEPIIVGEIGDLYIFLK
ncbi:chlorite dismutase family protein [Stygiolobus caldivivus]|uniref:Chlorite dismutase n=1 Tax=Stygiolobus caldivivus TaxID=2824673 RepID=A0A8D5U563_9CREN|nr:chlorite dismutase family protein [Stygiolobus caldivivus]BCU69275.1 chlorite dismutase [Stygiolobus caldivivus]